MRDAPTATIMHAAVSTARVARLPYTSLLYGKGGPANVAHWRRIFVAVALGAGVSPSELAATMDRSRSTVDTMRREVEVVFDESNRYRDRAGARAIREAVALVEREMLPDLGFLVG